MNKPIIYILNKTGFLPENLFNFFFQYVSKKKKEQIKNLPKEKADETLLSDIMVKVLIKKLFNIPIKNQKYSENENGKPYIVSNKNIFYNVSHCGEYIVCVFYKSEIGIDIQKIETFNSNLANFVCNENEIVLNDSEFTKLWSQKEAVLKKYGLGLAGDIKNCLKNEQVESIQIDDYWLSISI